MPASQGEPVYASDPNAAPDSEFVPGELARLVAGNHGRLLDARRTPIAITDVRPATGAFELEILAFEDAGARWELGLEEVARFQFARDAAVAAPGVVAELIASRARFAQPLHVECDLSMREATRGRVRAAREVARAWLTQQGWPGPDGAGALAGMVARAEGDPKLFGWLEEYLTQRELTDLERELTRTLVSNPHSGEVVKGHAVVMAELGLCHYDGPPLRNPDTFEPPWDKPRRAEHLVQRMAFTQALWAAAGHDAVELYRGAAVDGPLPERAPSSLVSATFSPRVAQEHFEGGPTTQTAVLWRQRVPVERLFMTFAETRAFNERFHEAEAVLVGDPANQAF